MVIPKKLKAGDQIRVVASSRSMSLINDECKSVANQRLQDLGLEVTFGTHVEESNEFYSSSIESRVSDLHEAFSDPNVHAIFSVLGGFNVNQILKYLDFDLIKNNPKIFCGYSDTTALSNAIYAKTGLVTYSGPHYSTFGMRKHFDYNLEYFKKCLFAEEQYSIAPSPDWSDDQWYIDQQKREIISNDGYWILNHGYGEGKIVGGNLGTLALLQGTEYYPGISHSILFLEECEIGESNYADEFDRLLQSIIHQPGFNTVEAIIIGRFQKSSKMNREILEKIIKGKKELDQMPIIANADFGHTNPLFTFPIGGSASISVSDYVELNILEH